jgi:hypothetical protein
VKRTIAGRAFAILAALSAAALTVPAVPANAENILFISDVTVASGAEAAAELEENGWHVLSVGLNDSVSDEKQVYLGYKLNSGQAVTNLLIAPDSGDTLTQDGITYTCAAHIDADENCGGGAGVVYYTKDGRAGSPLVGLNILKADVTAGEELLAIPNDGAEIVRKPDGAPADLELHSDTTLMYLAQIRDGIVCPYVSEVVPICDTDRWNAVYTAAQFGYNYFAEGDIDSSPDTCTILAYKRTANAAEALTAITAVAAETVDALEQGAENEALTGNAVSISGIEYVRTSAKAIGNQQPYYLYSTKDSAAGNPISMIYANTPDEVSETLFGTWVSGYFGVKGVSNAYSFAVNEDAMQELQFDRSVCVRLPVQLLQSAEPAEVTASTATQPESETTGTDTETTSAQTEPETTSSETEQQNADTNTETTSAETEQETTVSETEQETTLSETEQETTSSASTQQAASDAVQQTVSVSFLTFRDGLPESLSVLNGLQSSSQRTPILDHTQRADRDSKYQASAFSKGWYVLILGAAAFLIAVIAAFFIRKSAEKPQPVQSAAKKPAAKPEPPKAAPQKKTPVQNTNKPKSGKKKSHKKKK